MTSRSAAPRWRSSRSPYTPSLRSCPYPRMALMGVRSSWLMEAKKRERSLMARSSRAACSSRTCACSRVSAWRRALSSASAACRARSPRSGASPGWVKASGDAARTARSMGRLPWRRTHATAAERKPAPTCCARAGASSSRAAPTPDPVGRHSSKRRSARRWKPGSSTPIPAPARTSGCPALPGRTRSAWSARREARTCSARRPPSSPGSRVCTRTSEMRARAEVSSWLRLTRAMAPTRARSSAREHPLFRKSYAPISSPRTTRSSVGDSAVRKMTGTGAVCGSCLSRSTTWKPSISGMCTSRTMTSGLHSRARASPEGPSASATTSCPPCVSAEATVTRGIFWSSTTRMRAIRHLLRRARRARGRCAPGGGPARRGDGRRGASRRSRRSRRSPPASAPRRRGCAAARARRRSPSR